MRRDDADSNATSTAPKLKHGEVYPLVPNVDVAVLDTDITFEAAPKDDDAPKPAAAGGKDAAGGEPAAASTRAHSASLSKDTLNSAESALDSDQTRNVQFDEPGPHFIAFEFKSRYGGSRERRSRALRDP